MNTGPDLGSQMNLDISTTKLTWEGMGGHGRNHYHQNEIIRILLKCLNSICPIVGYLKCMP
jgi:hypothetical protein